MWPNEKKIVVSYPHAFFPLCEFFSFLSTVKGYVENVLFGPQKPSLQVRSNVFAMWHSLTQCCTSQIKIISCFLNPTPYHHVANRPFGILQKKEGSMHTFWRDKRRNFLFLLCLIWSRQMWTQKSSCTVNLMVLFIFSGAKGQANARHWRCLVQPGCGSRTSNLAHLPPHAVEGKQLWKRTSIYLLGHGGSCGVSYIWRNWILLLSQVRSKRK